MSDLTLQMGIYQHYKGPLYQVIGLAHDANEEGRLCVAYVGLQLNAAHSGPRLCVRTYDDFVALMDDGRPRFRYLGPVVPDEHLAAADGDR